MPASKKNVFRQDGFSHYDEMIGSFNLLILTTFLSKLFWPKGWCMFDKLHNITCAHEPRTALKFRQYSIQTERYKLFFLGVFKS